MASEWPLTPWEQANLELSMAWDEAWHEDEQRRRLAAPPPTVDVRANLWHAGVPALVIDALQAPETTPSVEHVAAFMASEKTLLVLSGTPGTGKTVAACSVLMKSTGLFAQAVDVARMSDFDAAALANLSRAPVLVLDDLGAEHVFDGWLSRLDGLINARYAAKLRTIITTNLDRDKFKLQYRERIADRLRQVGMFKSCGEKSMRRAAR